MRKTYRKNSIKDVIINHIENNIRSYLILTVIFFIGLVLGIMFINNIKVEEQQGIAQYINNFIEKINGDYEISKPDILIEAIRNNIWSCLILWILGCMVFGVPLIYIFIAYKGFCFGYTVSAVIASLGVGKGLVFVGATMLLQNIIYIPVYFAMANSGIRLHKEIIVDRKREEVKSNILKHTIFSLAMAFLILIGTFIESYVSGSAMEILSGFFNT